jgi:membrane dipeptidase
MPGTRTTRAEFLRLAAASAIGLCATRVLRAASEPGTATAPSAAVDPAARLIAESLVIDGMVTPHGKAHNSWPVAAGEVKRLYGIDATAWEIGFPDDLPHVNEFVAERADALVRIDTATHLVAARAGGKLGLLYYARRDFKLRGSIEPLARWHSNGLRVLQPAYHGAEELGGGSDEPDAPLTELGRKAVVELNRLGIVVDVSDCGRRTTLDVAALTEQPITANHSGAAAVSPHRRNKSDEELSAIAATGGVIGVTTAGRFLRRRTEQPERSGIDELVAQIEHLVRLVGVDHVGLSTEGFLDGADVYPADETDPLLDGSARWIELMRVLAGRGYARADLQKMLGLNFLRAYQKVLG